MRLHQAASLWVAALLSATGALADVKGVRLPPSFNAQEIELIARDPRLLNAARTCARQLREALDVLAGGDQGSRIGTAPILCQSGPGRASDEGALDILKILKDASEQGSSRSAGGDMHGGAAEHASPSFTPEEIALIQKDKRGRLMFAARRCAWQLREALDALHYGSREWPPQRPCWPAGGDSNRGTNEGALDILKILREASGDGNN